MKVIIVPCFPSDLCPWVASDLEKRCFYNEALVGKILKMNS